MSWNQVVVIRQEASYTTTVEAYPMGTTLHTYPNPTSSMIQWRRNPGANANADANADQNLGKFSGGMG